MQTSDITSKIQSLSESPSFGEEITDLLLAIANNFQEICKKESLSHVHNVFKKLENTIRGKKIEDLKATIPDIKLLDLSLGTE